MVLVILDAIYRKNKNVFYELISIKQRGLFLSTSHILIRGVGQSQFSRENSEPSTCESECKRYVCWKLAGKAKENLLSFLSSLSYFSKQENGFIRFFPALIRKFEVILWELHSKTRKIPNTQEKSHKPYFNTSPQKSLSIDLLALCVYFLAHCANFEWRQKSDKDQTLTSIYVWGSISDREKL